ncbi:adenine phosphoribosyltransferase [candidate division KSB1 bacterium]|nr:adenine phosphoribosyltransferase [candidate division KSB1 bacterium]
MDKLRRRIRNVPDFPKPGIQFKDITTLLKDGKSFAEVIDKFDEKYRSRHVDIIVGIESRGFIFGGALAYKLGVGFVPIRKPGKLPADAISEEYELEYGTDTMEIHSDAIMPGQNILIIDDLIATGGTMEAATRLIERLGGVIVGIAYLIDLTFLKGSEKVNRYDRYCLIEYDGD